jgi:hypothetical protein
MMSILISFHSEVSLKAHFSAFQRQYLYGLAIPDDLAECLAAHLSPDGAPELSALMEEAGVKTLDPDNAPDLLSTDYLSESDLADLDIRANIIASKWLFGQIAWFLEDDDSNLYGYWVGLEKKIDLKPIIVSYDTEGQFESLGKIGLGDLLSYIGSYGEDDRYAELAAAAQATRLRVDATTIDDYYAIAVDSEVDVKKIHNDVYDSERAKLGN